MPSNVAFLFPGQGRIPEALPSNAARFSHLLKLAHSAGLMLEDWIESGQVDRLAETDAAQPALLLDSLGREQLLRAAGWNPMCVAGHSLGEYAALVSSGVLDPTDAMRAVIERGRLMNQVRGTMAAILKLDLDTVTELCADTEAVVANHNAPTQIIVSGPSEAVQDVMLKAEEAGGRSIPLNVSGPFHSPLMLPAQKTLSHLLHALDFAAPTIPVISGVSGRVENEAEVLQGLLQRQITAIVRWVDVSSELDRLGVDTAIEVGSGDVLTRLGRRSDSSIRFLTFKEATHEED
ncbi:ACP S-malonyltransferase [Candidatus Bipolaricaulota bacterium]|nr:ACP S-malonyltransferase [Candidatus Bipolaricaulota bacterium]